mmetsp:Transcript_45113/g.146580  ORF Transcript_45113/g.146580 Transcript_45113/m.146580 type:complete len:287 (+) Transcript_45113:376-1236(+)
MTAEPAKAPIASSSERSVSTSRSLVGSSSSSRLGLRKRALARASRILHPPERASVGPSCCAALKPRPERIARACASAESRPSASSASYTSSSRIAAASAASSPSAASSSASSRASSAASACRSSCDARITSTADADDARASCATSRIERPAGMFASARLAMCARRVDLPLPFGPRKPYLRPFLSESRALVKSSTLPARIEKDGISRPSPSDDAFCTTRLPPLEVATNCEPIAPPLEPSSPSALGAATAAYSFHRSSAASSFLSWRLSLPLSLPPSFALSRSVKSSA